VVGAGLARGVHRRRGGDSDPDHHLVRFVGVGVYPQPGVIVRADLFHRYSGGRRHRGGGEHPSPHSFGRRIPWSRRFPLAVDEVGGPTILATFTVIAALLPMAFVSGLMGPYMSPIPINSSMGMLISLAVAFVFTPWLTYKVLRRVVEKSRAAPSSAAAGEGNRRPHARPQTEGETIRRKIFPIGCSGAWSGRFCGDGRPAAALAARRRRTAADRRLRSALAYFQLVVLKMLPFDNKSEFQVIVDMPEGTTLEQTARVLGEFGRYLGTVEEVTDYQVYAGTAAPINFNGWCGSTTCGPGPMSAIFRSTWWTRSTVTARVMKSRWPCAGLWQRSANPTTPMSKSSKYRPARR
jgi:hypothetical protein